MKTLFGLAIVALGVVGAVALLPTDAVAAKGKCVMAGGQGTGLGPDIAKQMATMALNNSIANYGGKAAGKVALTCDNMPILTTCTAKQRACK